MSTRIHPIAIAPSLRRLLACLGQLPFFTPSPMLMARFARDFARAGTIDPLVNLRKRRIYVYSGTEDRVGRPPAVGAAVTFFRQVGVDGGRLKYVDTLPSGHAMITPPAGNECAANAPPFINQCSVDGTGYDQAGALLQHIHGSTAARCGRAGRATARLRPACPCGAGHAAHNRWADSSRTLVLYAQVDKPSVPSDPQGCWGWWGYTGGDHAKKSAPQLNAIMAMVGRLVQRP